MECVLDRIGFLWKRRNKMKATDSLTRLGESYIKRLEDERAKMIIRRDMNLLLLSPRYKKTLDYASVNLAIEWKTLRIEILKLFI